MAVSGMLALVIAGCTAPSSDSPRQAAQYQLRESFCHRLDFRLFEASLGEPMAARAINGFRHANFEFTGGLECSRHLGGLDIRAVAYVFVLVSTFRSPTGSRLAFKTTPPQPLVSPRPGSLPVGVDQMRYTSSSDTYSVYVQDENLFAEIDVLLENTSMDDPHVAASLPQAAQSFANHMMELLRSDFWG